MNTCQTKQLFVDEKNLQNSRFLKIFHQRNGEIVTMTMVMMGLGMIVMAAVFTGILNIYKMQKNENLSQQQKDTIKQLENLLSLPGVCTAVFNGQNISGSIANPNNLGAATTMTSGATVLLNGKSIVLNPATNPEIAPGLILSGVKYLQKSNVSTTVTVAGVPRDGQDGALILSFKKSDTNNFFNNYKDTSINIQMATDGAGQIVSCATLGEEGQACESLNGVWRPLAPVGLKCQIRNTCITAGSFVGNNAPQSEGGFDNPFTGGRSCSAGFTPRNKGNIAFPYRTGKYDVKNRIYPVMECVSCIDNTGVRLSPGSVPSPSNYNANFDDVDTAAGKWLDQNGGFYGL